MTQLPHHAQPALCRVVRVDRGAAVVLTAAGAVRHLTALPVAVGDFVRCDDIGITEVLPRKTAIVRGTAGRETTAQVLAANVDDVLVLVPLSVAFRPSRLERLLAVAWNSGGVPVVVATKADLADDLDERLEQIALTAPGVEVIAVAAPTGLGVDVLRDRLAPGRTAALLGASGAGKSTLVNALAAADVMAVGDVRTVDNKGRHTTVHRELVVLPSGGAVIDTPGLRAIELWDGDEGVSRTFADVEELAAGCRFADCRHETEPGCAVTLAVQHGELAQRRVDSHRKLQRELAYLAARSDARLQAERRKEWVKIHKAQRVRGYRP